MLRIRAIQELLVEDIAGVRWPRGEDDPMGPKEALLGEVDLTNPAMPLGLPLK